MQGAEGAGIGHNSGVNPGNWIAVSRDMRDHPIVGMGQPVQPANPERGSYSRYEAWQDLLMEAQWKPFEVLNRGKTVTLKRGQLMAARSWLATRWNWSEKTVRVFITRLEEEFMVRSETLPSKGQMKGRFSNILTVCNYDIYQTVYELMKLSEDMGGARQGPDERPDEGPDKGPDELKEKPFNYNVIPIGEARKGPDEGPDKGPDKGPQYITNINTSLERESCAAREGTRMPDDWYLPNEWGQWAMHECKRDRDWVIAASKKFKDYWLSVPDSKGFKKNWRSTWQNWCRNTLQREAKYASGKPAKSGSSKYDKYYEGVL
jgi:hypothetical protein